MRQRNLLDIVHVFESNKRTWTICKRILTSANQLFGHACGKRLIDYNPCDEVPLPTDTERMFHRIDRLAVT